MTLLVGAERSEEEGERPVTSQIPRFAAFALKKKAEQDKVTPGNWAGFSYINTVKSRI